MTLTIELKPEMEAKLQRSARQRGLPVQEYIQQLIETAPAPAEEGLLPAASLRPFGLCAGEFTIPDDFDAPLPEEVIADFEGK